MIFSHVLYQLSYLGIAAISDEWRERLERQVGGRITLSADPALAMSAGHAH